MMKEKKDLKQKLKAKTGKKSTRLAAIEKVKSKNWKDVESLKSVMKDQIKNDDDGEMTLKIFEKFDEIIDARMIGIYSEVLQDKDAQDTYRKMALNSLLRLRKQGRIDNHEEKHGGVKVPAFNFNVNFTQQGENKITKKELKVIEKVIEKLQKSGNLDDEMKQLIETYDAFDETQSGMK